MSEHTAFPWHLCEPYQGCNGREVVGAIFGDDDGEAVNMIGEFERREDAAFAVHAAHCHDDLLAALRKIMAHECEATPCMICASFAREAIRKAEGTPE